MGELSSLSTGSEFSPDRLSDAVMFVEVTEGNSGDSPHFKPLVEATAKNFAMAEVSADKAYLSNANLQTVVDNNAFPFIPFKSNSVANAISPRPSNLWKQIYHLYSYNSEQFMQSYHKRSNVETTFHMIKAKFGIALRSKTKPAQINEALCKVLCHNICCLIQSIFELGIEPAFWTESS